MEIKIQNEANNVVKIDVVVPAKDAVNEYNKAVKKISEHVNIDGFRKGKAPRNIVEKQVGIERIKHEALEHLLPRIFQEAIISNKLDVVSQPYVDSYEFNIGEDLKVSAKVELRPEVKLGEYKNVNVDVESFELPESAFDDEINALMKNNTIMNLVVDRETSGNDVVVIDFDGSVNGEKIKGGASENYPLDIANSNFIPGFAEQLVGKKLDEEFEISVNFPTDYHEEKLAGQPAVFKIKIKEIREKMMPELNDEFAQKVGPFKTVDELKADIQKYLDNRKTTEDTKNASAAVFNKIVESANVDIQSTMIDREAQSLLEEYKNRLASQGIPWEQVVKDRNENDILEELKGEAQVRIKNSLVIDKIAQEEKITVDHADLDKKLQEVESAYKVERADMLKQLKQNPAIINSLSQQILNEKVSTFLSENNTVNFKPKSKTKVKVEK